MYKTVEVKQIHNQDGVYFLIVTVIQWIDIFTQNDIKGIVVKSLKIKKSRPQWLL
tara:strand:+ start:266 stop:430 length:165 start_codon:yes stop_codon:yes gene_type:complete